MSLQRLSALALLLSVVAGCRSRPSAMDVCKRLVDKGIGSNCTTAEPKGIGVAAKEHVDFDLASVKGKTGQVLSFESDDAYQKTVDAFEKLSKLAGPHRYGSPSARIFVQLNEKASEDDGAKAKEVVQGL